MHDSEHIYALNQRINEEFSNQRTQAEKRGFVESIRFLMLSDNSSFQNYYSNKNLTVDEFYSTVDALYQQDNLLMLSIFLEKNQIYLFQGLERLLNFNGQIDFQETCKIGEDTMLERMFMVLQDYTMSYKQEKGTGNNERKKIKSL